MLFKIYLPRNHFNFTGLCPFQSACVTKLGRRTGKLFQDFDCLFVTSLHSLWYICKQVLSVLLALKLLFEIPHHAVSICLRHKEVNIFKYINRLYLMGGISDNFWSVHIVYTSRIHTDRSFLSKWLWSAKDWENCSPFRDKENDQYCIFVSLWEAIAYQKRSFLDIVQMAFAPPRFEHVCCNFLMYF